MWSTIDSSWSWRRPRFRTTVSDTKAVEIVDSATVSRCPSFCQVKWIFSTRPVVQVPTFEVVTQKSLVLEVTYLRKSKVCYRKWIIFPGASKHKWNEFFLQGKFLKYLLQLLKYPILWLDIQIRGYRVHQRKTCNIFVTVILPDLYYITIILGVCWNLKNHCNNLSKIVLNTKNRICA